MKSVIPILLTFLLAASLWASDLTMNVAVYNTTGIKSISGRSKQVTLILGTATTVSFGSAILDGSVDYQYVLKSMRGDTVAPSTLLLSGTTPYLRVITLQ